MPSKIMPRMRSAFFPSLADVFGEERQVLVALQCLRTNLATLACTVSSLLFFQSSCMAPAQAACYLAVQLYQALFQQRSE